MSGGSQGVVRYGLLQTRLGRLLVVADARALRRVQFVSARMWSEPDHNWKQGSALVDEAVRQLRAYFAGQLREFNLPAGPEGTSFERAVWTQLQQLRYGTTATYGQVARRIGRPTAWRAVGGACGKNPVGVIIPCHRVVGADGSLTGFSAGLARKRRLLALERSHVR